MCQCTGGQTSAIENLADFSAGNFGMKYEYGAANLVSKFMGGRKVEQDYLKQLKIELDQSTQKCDEMEREFDAAKVSRL